MRHKVYKILLFIIVFGLIMAFVSCFYNQNHSVKDVENTEIENGENVEIKSEPRKIPSDKKKPTEYIEDLPEPEPVFVLSDYERRVAECIVMGESGGEPYDGQVLVAQCLLNACLKEDIQPSVARIKYGYAGWNNSPSNSVKSAVSKVFDQGYKITEECILYFYAPVYGITGWHESQKFVIEIGGHRFFAEKED